MTNAEWLYENDPELLLDTACGFKCCQCACRDVYNCYHDWDSDECKIRKIDWLSDWRDGGEED